MIPGNSYREVRYELLFKSLTVKRVVRKLREYYGIPVKGISLKKKNIDEVLKRIIGWVWKKFPTETKSQYESFLDTYGDKNLAYATAADKVKRDKLLLLYKFANKLGVDWHDFEYYVLFNFINYSYAPGLRIVVSKDFPLEEPGVYLKVDSYTNGEELKKWFNHVKPFLKKSFSPIVYKNKVRRKSTGYDRKKDIAAFTRIENRLIKYYDEKNKARNIEMTEHYEKLMWSVFDDLAAVLIPEMSEELEEEAIKKRHKQLETTYYDITDRYSLPTVKDLQNYLRLIPQ